MGKEQDQKANHCGGQDQGKSKNHITLDSYV